MSIPSDKDRITELESYQLEKGYPKEELKSILKLASNICRTSVSLIDIIDDYNQRTIVTYGDWEEKIIPKQNSICNNVVIEDEMLVINNVKNNEKIYSRLTDEDKEKIKFYAGAPLKSPAGYNLGALCVIDSKPRILNEFQKESLKILANEVMARLNLNKKTRALERKNKKLEKYSIFLNNSADILWIINPSSSIVDINEGSTKELGYSTSELIDRNINDFIYSDVDINFYFSKWLNQASKGKNRFTKILSLKDKSRKQKWFRCNFTFKNGLWYLTARNITSKKKADDRVKALNSKFEKVAYATTDLIYEMNWSERAISWSSALTDFLGYPESDRYVSFEWWKNKVHPKDRDYVMNEIMNVLDSSDKKCSVSYRIRANDGTYKHVINNSHIERDEEGSPTIIIGALEDITKLREAEIRCTDLISKLKHANHLAELGFLELNLKDDSVTLDDEMNKIIESNNNNPVKTLNFILNGIKEEDRTEFIGFINKVKNSGRVIGHEQKIRFLDGSYKYLLHRGEFIAMENSPGKILVATQNVTERKSREIHIEESLEEKEILLSEIHHRVKNNLAIISAMLELKMFQVKDIGIINFIRSTQLRIKSMAKIHEKLYQSESFSLISFKEYLEELIEAIQSTLKTQNDPEIIMTIEDIQLNINYAIPCGLILNELITNAWKYAFPNQNTGKISISLYKERDIVYLSINDNGVGLPEGLDYMNSDTLGLSMVDVLCEQINGELTIKNTSNGVSFLISFRHIKDKRGPSGNPY